MVAPKIRSTRASGEAGTGAVTDTDHLRNGGAVNDQVCRWSTTVNPRIAVSSPCQEADAVLWLRSARTDGAVLQRAPVLSAKTGGSGATDHRPRDRRLACRGAGARRRCPRIGVE